MQFFFASRNVFISGRLWSWDLTRLYTNLDSFIIQLTRKILPSKYRKDLQFLMRKKTIKSALRNDILLPKLFLPTVRKNCFSDWEKLLKFEAERQEFANFLRSLEQFIELWKFRTIFEAINFLLEVSNLTHWSV